MNMFYPKGDEKRPIAPANTPFIRVIILLIIITILVGIFVFMRTPSLQWLWREKNTQRWADVNIIMNSFYAYFVEHKVFPPNIDEKLRVIGTDNGDCSIMCGGKEGWPREVRMEGSRFNDGEFENVFYDATDGYLKLTEQGRQDGKGAYTSPVIDAGLVSTWDSFGWVPAAPYAKELPVDGAAEMEYPEGNTPMDKAALLLHLNDPIGSTVFYDFSKSYSDALCLGVSCPSGGAAGVFEGAVLFEGDDVLAVPHDELLISGRPFSFSIWIKPYSLPSYAPIVTKSSNASFDDGYGLYYDGDTRSLCAFVTTGQTAVVCAPFLRQSVFSQVGVIYSGSAVALYIDGDEVGSTSVSGSLIRNEMPLFLGGDMDHNGWDGLMDEFVFFDQALSPTEMASLYMRGVIEVKYQVRSCNSNKCSGVRFVGPDNTPNTYFSETENSDATLDPKRSFGIQDDRYFQYKAYFETADKEHSPKIRSVLVGYGYGGINGEQTAERCMNLAPSLEGKFLDRLPTDPDSGTLRKTQYAIKRTESGRIVVQACYTDGGEIISVVK